MLEQLGVVGSESERLAEQREVRAEIDDRDTPLGDGGRRAAGVTGSAGTSDGSASAEHHELAGAQLARKLSDALEARSGRFLGRAREAQDGEILLTQLAAHAGRELRPEGALH